MVFGDFSVVKYLPFKLVSVSFDKIKFGFYVKQVNKYRQISFPLTVSDEAAVRISHRRPETSATEN